MALKTLITLLLSYLQVEFNLKKYEDINFESLKEIRFWSSFLE